MALLVLLLFLFLFFREKSPEDDFFLEKYANADAKFFGDLIVTSVEEKIVLLDFQGNAVKTYEDTKASWFYTYPEENRILYSNHDQQVHLMTLDEELEVQEDRILFQTDLLAIDPTICKVEDTYLVTYTTIDGIINNPDPQGENGTYTVELFASKDLEQWQHRATITSQKQNIEDIDLLYPEDGKGCLYLFYEKELCDKGVSQILMRKSLDQGVTWSEETEILPAVADNEMACILPWGEGYRMYYSSDYSCVGESYNGASIYYAQLDQDLLPVSTYEKVQIHDNQGIRLYEVCEKQGKRYFLFSHNFITEKDFVLRSTEIEK